MLVTCVIETRQNEEEDRLCCRLSQYSNLVVVVVRATEAATATIDEAYFWSTIHIQKQTLLSIQVEKEERETESKEREGEGKKERKTEIGISKNEQIQNDVEPVKDRKKKKELNGCV